MTQDEFYTTILARINTLLETINISNTTLTSEQLAQVEAKELEARRLQAEANKAQAELSLYMTKSQLETITKS